MSERELILTLACPDQRGIVYAVARAIAEGGGNILDSQQFGDPDASVFFMRVHFADAVEGTLESWHQNLAPVAEAHAMRWAARRRASPTGPGGRVTRGSLPE